MTDISIQDIAKPDTWDFPIKEGMRNAVMGISQMIGHKINIDLIKIQQIPNDNISIIFDGAEAPAIGIYLAFSGAANGHFMLAHKPELAYKILNMKDTNYSISKNLRETEQSTIGEMGNIMGISFLNTIRNIFKIPLHISTPVILFDKAKALIDIAFTEILQEQNNTFMVKSTLDVNQQAVQGTFLIMLNSNLTQISLKSFGENMLNVKDILHTQDVVYAR